jgi:hypothetical protein
MWLADDDNLTYPTIEILHREIKKKKKTVTVMPNWQYLKSINSKVTRLPIEYNSNFFFLRLIKFLFIGDDCSVYGMHTTSLIKKINFSHTKYFYPNENVSWNLAYLFVIKLLTCGKISSVKNKRAIWINNDYKEIKYHSKIKNENFFIKNIKLLILKINFYFLVLNSLIKLKKYFELLLVIIFLPFIVSYKYYSYVIHILKSYYQNYQKILN